METQIAQISGMVLGLVAVLSSAGLTSKYKGIASVVIGAGLGYLYAGFSIEGITIGILGGLTASGVWSATKTTMKK